MGKKDGGQAARVRVRKSDARGTARETHLTDVAPHYYFADTDDSILVRCCCTTAHGVTATVRFFLRSPRNSRIRGKNGRKSDRNRRTAVRGTKVPRYFNREHDEVLFPADARSFSFSPPVCLSLFLSLTLFLSHAHTLRLFSLSVFPGTCPLAFRQRSFLSYIFILL